MKKTVWLFFMVIMVLILASSAYADNKAKAFSFSPFVGGYMFEGNENLNNKPIAGLRLGYDFTKNWGVEGLFEYLKTEYDIPALTSKTNVFGYRLEALYNFMPESRWVPYLAVGAGGRSLGYDHELVNNRNQVALDYGAGLKYFLYSDVALRGDVRHIIALNDRFNNLEYTLGATVYFGGSKQAAAPVVVDSDNDGVSDNYDKCPGTPIGVKVDQDGCPLDTDKDGVTDNLDKCPGTPEGVKVDQDGCPLDSDKDGVADYLDKCPGTPIGVKVDQDGCPLDSDKDGVPDYLDKCPGTPMGVKVDENGCPPVEQLQEVRAEAPAAAAVVETKEAVAAAAVAKEIFEKGRATINVEFDTNKADIKPAFDKEIQKFADVMKNYPDLKVVIEGHTDNVGGKVPNEKLSAKRANSVKDYLTKKFGIAESRLTAKGYGMSKPLDSNKTKAGRQKNRRVEAAVDYTIKK
ncbi:MAG: OmpA family protein [Deltaproteobacteria bacterium]|nr:OmpA family protein [Deltaproteobacteria bacterium]